MRSSDRTERVVTGLLIDRVAERRRAIEDDWIERMANAIAKRFG